MINNIQGKLFIAGLNYPKSSSAIQCLTDPICVLLLLGWVVTKVVISWSLSLSQYALEFLQTLANIWAWHTLSLSDFGDAGLMETGVSSRNPSWLTCQLRVKVCLKSELGILILLWKLQSFSTVVFWAWVLSETGQHLRLSWEQETKWSQGLPLYHWPSKWNGQGLTMRSCQNCWNS